MLPLAVGDFALIGLEVVLLTCAFVLADALSGIARAIREQKRGGP